MFGNETVSIQLLRLRVHLERVFTWHEIFKHQVRLLLELSDASNRDCGEDDRRC
jgi:hypothetical protein